MTNSELILHLVDKYIVEREKNIILQQKFQQPKEVQDKKQVKTNKKQ